MDSSPGCYVSLKKRRAGQEVMLSSNGAAANWAASAASNEVRRGMAQARLIRLLLILIALLPRCGAPFFKDCRDEVRVLRLGQGLHQYVVILIDEWTYNLGPNQFLRILSFENGKLVEVRSGDRGF